MTARVWSRREVLAYLDRIEPLLDRLNHFELLGVSPEAPEPKIQAAFHRLASGTHPDRLRAELSFAERERVTVVYARIAEAYRVLRNEDLRSRYIQEQLEREKEGKEPGLSEADALALLSPKAQRLYRRARTSLRTGDRASAVLNLRIALRLHPNSQVLEEALAEAQKPR